MSDSLIIQPGTPYHLGLDQVGYATFVVSILFVLLATLAVGLRLYTRRLLRNKIGIDDWLIIASLVVFFGFTANALVCVFTYGGGQHYEDETKAQKKYVQYMKAEYIVPPLYTTNVTLVKMSTLVYYRRLFPVESFQRFNTGTMVICMLWFVAGLITDMLYCRPIRYFWDTTIEGSCFFYPAYFMSMEVIDLLLDLIIIALPTPTILGLRLSLRKRIAVLAIFGCCSLVLITGAVRIFYIYVPDNQIINLDKAGLWSVINMGVSIFCACLPTYRPLLSKLSLGPIWKSFRPCRSRKRGANPNPSPSTAGFGHNNNNLNGKNGSMSARNKNRRPNYYRMDNLTVDCAPLAEVVAEERRLEVMEGREGIRVQRDFGVV